MNKELEKAIHKEKNEFYERVQSSLDEGNFYKIKVGTLLGVLNIKDDNILIRLETSSFKDVAEKLKI